MPDDEVNEFIEISPIEFVITGESKYTKEFREKLKTKLPTNKKDQLGWYLQQFIKLYAAKDNAVSATVLIWDADTAPITELNFINTDGKIQYYNRK